MVRSPQGTVLLRRYELPRPNHTLASHTQPIQLDRRRVAQAAELTEMNVAPLSALVRGDLDAVA